MASWICDGIPKDGKQYPDRGTPHEPYENKGTDCLVCGLPQESAIAATQKGGSKPPKKTIFSGKSQSSWLIPVSVAVVLLAIAGGGFAAYQFLTSTREGGKNEEVKILPSDTLVGETAQNHPQLISQGEKLFFSETASKKAGAAAFADKNWDLAVEEYDQAATSDRNDPEAKIYGNNAKAQQAGNPLTMAVVLPITADLDAAKEVLRGVALKQDQFNQAASGQLLEVVVVNEVLPATSVAIAEDLSQFANLLGVMGHSVTPDLDLAMRVYQGENLAVLSPINIDVSSEESLLKLVPPKQKSAQLLADYLASISNTAIAYAKTQHSRPAVAIFYNSQRDYSENQRQTLVKIIEKEGTLVQEIDIKAGDFEATQAVKEAIASGANTAFLALNKEEISEAVAIAQANKDANTALTAIGGDQLYNPDILVEGGDAIADLVLAVPWRYEEQDDFAKTALTLWQGRVSWRTAAAYDVTQALSEAIAQAGDRAEVISILEGGVKITGSNADFEIFTRVPLVKAVQGSGGPTGSDYRFDPVES
ncbi:ABC transporter substrate-binding protein [Spirulina sp. 06S082]|uniref:ABC transporter substrate-binding protein n=1 Tax=Spirulina sp. 06S082 TaxID=3110248 RepID=UPI002B1F2694|nr:ABC transporter substrate-binding protein [Spirulina sp. 06S082]MEA5468418.1 ABC transporter substrate-binding protein [Spirulina sp. 06S082]